jgi:hypothetical protein
MLTIDQLAGLLPCANHESIHLHDGLIAIPSPVFLMDGTMLEIVIGEDKNGLYISDCGYLDEYFWTIGISLNDESRSKHVGTLKSIYDVDSINGEFFIHTNHESLQMDMIRFSTFLASISVLESKRHYRKKSLVRKFLSDLFAEKQISVKPRYKLRIDGNTLNFDYYFPSVDTVAQLVTGASENRFFESASKANFSMGMLLQEERKEKRLILVNDIDEDSRIFSRQLHIDKYFTSGTHLLIKRDRRKILDFLSAAA